MSTVPSKNSMKPMLFCLHPAFHRHNLTFQRRALGGHVAQIKHILICHKYFLFSADKMSAFLSVYTAI